MKLYFLAIRGLLIAMGIVLAPLLSAQQPAPQTKAFDVTAPVSAMVKNNELTVTVNTALAGGQDPARKVVKKLLVIYAIDGQENTMLVSEGKQLKLTAPAGKALTVKKALYGDLPDHPDTRLLLATSFPAVPSAQSSATPPTQADTNEVNGPNNIAISLPRPALQISLVKPVRFEKRGNSYFADFGTDAYGNLQITFPTAVPAGTLTIRLGEKMIGTAIDRKPPGSVNYCEVKMELQPGKLVYQPEIPIKKGGQSRDTAVKTPPESGTSLRSATRKSRAAQPA